MAGRTAWLRVTSTSGLSSPSTTRWGKEAARQKRPWVSAQCVDEATCCSPAARAASSSQNQGPRSSVEISGETYFVSMSCVYLYCKSRYFHICHIVALFTVFLLMYANLKGAESKFLQFKMSLMDDWLKICSRKCKYVNRDENVLCVPLLVTRLWMSF